MIEIKDGDTLIAKILPNQDWPENLCFYSEADEFLQVASWNYNTGKHLKAHGHNFVERVSNRTHELLFIKSGKIKAFFYNDDNKFLTETIFSAGDIVIIHNGGHAYDILEDNTQVLEVKNGPYPGLETDKKVIEP